MSNRLPVIAGAATLGLIGAVAFASQVSRQAQPRLATRTADRLLPLAARSAG